MSSFDPFHQNVTFLAADGETEIQVPLLLVDAINNESVSICINYGAQLGASLVLLVTVLVMTPSSKLRRRSNVLNVLGLLFSTIRMVLLCAYFPSPFNAFYAFWAQDYSRVPRRDYDVSITANTFSLFLVVIMEAALMNQAWTMVSLWPRVWKYLASAASIVFTMATIGWRIAFTVIQNDAVLSLTPPSSLRWLLYAMLISNAISICWFCALFNIKLVIHLVSNRGVLPSSKNLTPMEILVMTNGILMIVPGMYTLGSCFPPLVHVQPLTIASHLCRS